MNAVQQLPPLAKVVEGWKRDGLKKASVYAYQEWVNRFVRHCAARDDSPLVQLSAVGGERFVRTYARQRHIKLKESRHAALNALHALSVALTVLGVKVPAWREPGLAQRLLSRRLQDYLAFRRTHSNAQDQSIMLEISAIDDWLKFLKRRRRRLSCVRLRDVDDYMLRIRGRFAVSTTSRVMSSLRIFLRYLHVTGRLRHDLACSVQCPPRRCIEPPRVLPWADVRRILRAVDRSTLTGARDYAMLLLMSLYGFGAAEIINLKLNGIDWRRRTLTVVRSKTGVVIHLPLLPAAGQALAAYLHHGRPSDASRAVFLRRPIPHSALSRGAVGFAVRRYAEKAGVQTRPLGAHSFRHSHATRQVEQQVPVQVLSTILGHTDPRSVSSYTRVAIERLRRIALPVPR